MDYKIDNVEKFLKLAFLELYELYEVEGWGYEYLKEKIDNFHYYVSHLTSFKDARNMTPKEAVDTLFTAYPGEQDRVHKFIEDYYLIEE